ncbi:MULTISPECIES: hypothetical protein [unclassified Novosphingobium]|uniref:hypothetical protein n=1 Tax=unclassified Novosphingobium TaxID=2644732 RepID=UPI001060E203|nr:MULTISPECIES: hypothetical protein [unclassified Novosphingobium]
MSADWEDFTERQLDVLLALDFAMPVHEGYARFRLRLPGASISALVGRGLVRRHFYVENPDLPGIPFLTLSKEGERVRRSWIRWCQRVRDKVGSVPPGLMQRAVEARP